MDKEGMIRMRMGGRRTAAIRLIAVLLAAAALLAGLSGCGTERYDELPEAADGVLDLTSWDFSDGQAAMNGEWLFYPHRLLEPSDMPAEDGVLAEVPRSWNSYSPALGFDGGLGYGTYRLLVLTDSAEPTLSIRVPNIYTAYRLWVNGELVASRGTPAISADAAVPAQSPRIATFASPPDGKLDILLQAANFHHRRGGIWVDLTIGATPDVIAAQTNVTAQSMVLFGSLMIIGLYHIALFAKRREESFTLHFGLLCLFVGIRVVVTGENLLMRWVPAVTWEAGLMIDYCALTLSALSGYLYVFALFPKEASVKIGRAVIGCAMLLCAGVLLMPPYLYTKLLLVYQGYIIVVSILIFCSLVQAKRRKREGAGFVLAGVAVFTFAALNDMIYYNEWGRTTELVPVGLFFFILMQAVVLSSRFSWALRNVETVSGALRELNVHLEDRIEERTEALQRMNKQLEASNDRLERMEKSRRHLMTNISHDLRTPMTLVQGYLEAMQDGLVQDREKQAQYVKMMLGKIESLNRLIGELFELSKLESGQAPLDKRLVAVHEWAAALYERHALDIETQGMAFEMKMIDDCASDDAVVVAEIDEARMEQAISNLIYNAIKYAGEGGSLRLSFGFDRNRQLLAVELSDTGTGIDPDDLPFIFDRFYMKDKSRNSAQGGSGIGLAIVKEIVELHGGTVEALSTPGSGATIRLNLPASELKEEYEWS